MFVKSLGAGMYSIGAMMLVLFISENPFYSGLAFFVVTLPSCFSFLIAPFTNYVSFKKALIICELTKFILLLFIPILYQLSLLHVTTVIIIMFLVSIISTFTYPIETTLIPAFVGKDNVVKENSYINMLRESLDVVFLAVSGIIIAMIGRVITILVSLSAIGQPFGALLGGAISSTSSPIYPIMMAGIMMICFSIYFFAHPLLRSLPSIAKITFFTTSGKRRDITKEI